MQTAIFFNMTVLNSLTSPISITFAVIILGYYFGRIKVLGVSLDLAGVLIVAVAAGWLLTIVNPIKEALSASDFQTNIKFFSSFGTALFVSVIGITTGYSLDIKRRKDMKAALIGSLMVISAFITMKLISVLDTDISISKLLGSLCGALTTTPGLSAASELKSIVAEEATLGYGCAYLLGVVFTVLFVQITTRKSTKIFEDKVCTEKSNSNKVALGGLVQIGFAVLIGRLLGNIKILDFSFGNSGGMLCIGVAIGLIIKTYFSEKIASQKTLSHFRNLGLVLFFVGNGIPAGMQLGCGLEVKIVLYGSVMTIVSILVGALLYKIIFKNGVSADVVAGGMTSTPSIGILVEKDNSVKLGRYSLAYIGALLTIIMLVRIIFK